MKLLVTGAASGLGRVIAEQLAKEGYSLLLHHFRSDPKEVLQACRSYGVEAESIQADLKEPQSLIQEISSWEIGGLVNNAALFMEDHPGASTIAEQMLVNYASPVALIEGLLPMVRASKGQIVNIGTAGIGRPTVTCTSHAASKAALWKYTLSLAKAVPEVSCNMVSPGVLERSQGDPKAPRVKAEEVARVVSFLLKNPAITGQNIEVARGFLL